MDQSTGDRKLTWKCLVCSAEYEVPKSRRLSCDSCDDKARNTPGQFLTVEERLWGKCYEKDQHWEYGATRHDGRSNPVMLDRRQVPAAQAALIISGQPRPSPEHVARIRCGNRACVRPDHLEWAAKLTGRALKWGEHFKPEELAGALRHKREQHAKYQRNYRANLKRFDVRSMRDVNRANLAERVEREEAFLRTGRYVEPVAVPYPLTPSEPTPGPAAVPPVDVSEIAEGPSGLAAAPAPVVAPVELGALLGGVKLAGE